MSTLRSWKERWHPDAEFVFAKRLKMGLDPEKPWVLPGDPVDKNLFGLSRLRRWWEARVIRLAKPDVNPQPEKVGRIVRLTNTVWEVRRPGRDPQRVDSRGEADRLLAEHEATLVQTEKGTIIGKLELVQLNSQMFELRVPGKEPVKIRGKHKAKEALEAAKV